MALRLSTNLRNRLLGAVPAIGGASLVVSSRIAAVTGTPDSFTDSGSGFVTAEFAVGDTIMVSGFTLAANNGIFTIATVAAGTIEIVETTVVNESAGALNIKMQVVKGGSLKDIFKDGVLKVYSGAQPTTADTAYAGTQLLEISVASGAFVSGAAANGLEFGTASAGAISKNTDVWSDTGIASGTAGWFRLYANATDTGGADTTPFLYPRIDGAVGTSGAELNMSSTSITLGATSTIDTFTITFPAA